jgi:hypothetical protein
MIPEVRELLVFESGTDREAVNMPMGAYVRVERPAIVPLVRAARGRAGRRG